MNDNMERIGMEQNNADGNSATPGMLSLNPRQLSSLQHNAPYGDSQYYQPPQDGGGVGVGYHQEYRSGGGGGGGYNPSSQQQRHHGGDGRYSPPRQHSSPRQHSPPRHHHGGGDGGSRRGEHGGQNLSLPNRGYSLESDITSTAGYTLSGGHHPPQQHTQQQTEKQLSHGRYIFQNSMKLKR